jgi:hypothetical protein
VARWAAAYDSAIAPSLANERTCTCNKHHKRRAGQQWAGAHIVQHGARLPPRGALADATSQHVESGLSAVQDQLFSMPPACKLQMLSQHSPWISVTYRNPPGAHRAQVSQALFRQGGGSGAGRQLLLHIAPAEVRKGRQG